MSTNKKSNDKATRQRAHAKRRALERYGLDINRRRMKEIVVLLQAGLAEFLERQSCRISLWKMNIDGVDVRVVYDNKRKTIVSFLPLEDQWKMEEEVIPA